MNKSQQAENWHIRAAIPSDLDAMVFIEQACFNSDCFNRRQLRYLLTKAQALCLAACKMNENILGFGICLTPKRPKPARLYSLAVLPDYRHLGIARSLIHTMREQLITQQYRHWRLEVNERNNKALQLYRQEGFNSVQVLPRYYQNGDSALRMQQQLVHQASNSTLVFN